MKLVLEKIFLFDYFLNVEEFRLILLLLLLKIGLFSYRADIYDTRWGESSNNPLNCSLLQGIKAKQSVLCKWRGTWDLTSILFIFLKEQSGEMDLAESCLNR